MIYVPFGHHPIQVTNVTVDGPSAVTYNAESHDFSFVFDGEKVYEGVDYTVYYVPVGHDATEASSTDVKNVGDYKAVITGYRQLRRHGRAVPGHHGLPARPHWC